ncbi:VOC family protein [Microbacterium sp. C5A9]|uniref:VOC family protein n=1 Tax=Microbacterium sp. C5A9 TaxID=2736663 RepID=UPI001F51C271|nr:VOC family protein [Microbacterium sp. C5A9]MCI1017274.1 VOC family protein [Microbacterium sp. C5A9]
MALLDHLGITVDDLETGRAQFHPVLAALGYESGSEDDHSISWHHGEETELIIFAPRDEASGPHVHGRVGWQHLAFAVDSRDDVDRLHAVAVAAGWTVVREPQIYERFSENYYASFVEDAGGIRVEFMHNPPRTS